MTTAEHSTTEIASLTANLQLIACAGAGKTQRVAERVVDQLELEGVEPENDDALDEALGYELIVFAGFAATPEAQEYLAPGRVYDNAHGQNEMHRHTLSGGKQAAEPFAASDFGEAMRAAREAVLDGYGTMVESWRR